jgi:hypothetical protein
MVAALVVNETASRAVGEGFNLVSRERDGKRVAIGGIAGGSADDGVFGVVGARVEHGPVGREVGDVGDPRIRRVGVVD